MKRFSRLALAAVIVTLATGGCAGHRKTCHNRPSRMSHIAAMQQPLPPRVPEMASMQQPMPPTPRVEEMQQPTPPRIPQFEAMRQPSPPRILDVETIQRTSYVEEAETHDPTSAK
jgi:hypothetical protein